MLFFERQFPFSWSPGVRGRSRAGAAALAFLAMGAGLVASDLATSALGLKRMSLDELMDVQVTSVSRAPEKLSETASAIQVVTHEEIQRSGATTLAEALVLANNLNVARKNSHDWGISARGFNTELSNKLLVLMDGRTLYTPLFSGVRWDVQDYLLEDMDRIEVISGPGGTLWGANAVNGVINFTSKSSQDTQGWYAETEGGTVMRQGYGLRYGGTIAPHVSYRVYGKYIDRGAERLSSGTEANDNWHRGQAGFRMDAGSPEQGMATVQGDIYHGGEGAVSGGQSSVGGGNVLGRISRQLHPGSELSLQVYFDRAHFRQPVAASGFAPAGMFQDDLDTYDVDFQHRWEFAANNRLVWGAGYRRTIDGSRAAPGFGFEPPGRRQDLVSSFAQDEITFSDAYSATFGTKIEHTDYTGTEFEPTLRLQWKGSARDTVWSAVSRAVRTPSRIDRDIREPSRAPIILQGGGDFASETLTAYELGYRTELHPNIVGSIAAFYNRYDKIRSVRTTPVTFFPLEFANDLEGSTYGFELTANYQAAAWWRLTAGYNLLKEDVHVKAGRADLNNALNEVADPEQQASLRSSMDLGPMIQLDANLRWVDALTVNNNGRVATVPSYAELDVRVAWQINKNWEFALVGRNLLDRQHPEFGVPGPGQVELRRNIYAQSSWRY